MVLPFVTDYRPSNKGVPIGVTRHSGGGRMSGARLVLLAALAALVLGAGPLAPKAAAAASRVAPKVVLIVGPAGGATPYYRRLADEAAAAAAKLTPNVVKVYSPDATWTNVKAALQGASVVVYLGHGNGWPSIYRDALYPPTQNGFGLNPHAGAADSHQYFGEEQIGSQIKLAKDAVVIFSHLCYASGNTEPGLAEGTLAQAQQRVDNYAAGFFRAGAGAVIADAYLSPTYYVRSVLRGDPSIDSIWKNAPNWNDHFLRFASQRTKGAIAQMDPDNVDSGFHRSIVLKAKLTSGQVVGNAGPAPSSPIIPIEPSLDRPRRDVRGAGSDHATDRRREDDLTLPIAQEAAALLPAELMVGTRWDRLDAGAPAARRARPRRAPRRRPAHRPPAAGAGTPTVGGDDPGTTAPDDPGRSISSSRSEPARSWRRCRAKRLPSGGISVPGDRARRRPGLYRLVATVHQPDGVAYDASTQALVPALVVRVTGPLTATYAAPATATTAGRGAVPDERPGHEPRAQARGVARPRCTPSAPPSASRPSGRRSSRAGSTSAGSDGSPPAGRSQARSCRPGWRRAPRST